MKKFISFAIPAMVAVFALGFVWVGSLPIAAVYLAFAAAMLLLTKVPAWVIAGATVAVHFFISMRNLEEHHINNAISSTTVALIAVIFFVLVGLVYAQRFVVTKANS